MTSQQTLEKPDLGAAKPGKSGTERPLRTGEPNVVAVWLVRILILVALIGGWSYLGGSSDHWQRVLSTPLDVVEQLKVWLTDSSFYTHHVWATFLEASLGYVIGVSFAILLVALVASSRVVERLMMPFITVLAVLPKLALIPLFITLFGITLESKVYFVASSIFIIVFHSVHTGLRTTDRLMIENLSVLGASTWNKIRHLYLPSVLSWLVSSLRFSVAFALLAAVISEYLGAMEGLGYLISQGEAYFRTQEVLAGIFVVAVIALIFDRLLMWTQRRLSRWQVA
ncbi:NitT/TauT family transport system permease protein [Rhodococcus sp. 27YEA15]|uniref:ABC transporter permease n=1 Tax=Rhodococcus sp. 27YEA15 TaxID=3156259 RepID=UPI003C7CC79A